MRRNLAVLLLMVIAASCSSHPGATDRSVPTATERAMRREAGIPIPLPVRAKSSKDVDAVHQLGEDLFITKDGFKPKSMTAKVQAKIRITNETDKTQTVRFVNWPWTSPPIAPGKTVTYTPDSTVAINYVLASDEKVTGSILVEPWYDPADPNAPRPSATK